MASYRSNSFLSVHKAIRSDDQKGLVNLIAAGAPLVSTITGKVEGTALHYAAQYGMVECLKILLPHCVEFVNHRAPILDAFRYGRGPVVEMCKLFVAYGAKVTPEISNREGKTALHLALSLTDTASALELSRLFTDHGADIHRAQIDGLPLHYACLRHNSGELVRLLLDKETLVARSKFDYHRFSFPHLDAARGGNIESLRELLVFGEANGVRIKDTIDMYRGRSREETFQIMKLIGGHHDMMALFYHHYSEEILRGGLFFDHSVKTLRGDRIHDVLSIMILNGHLDLSELLLQKFGSKLVCLPHFATLSMSALNMALSSKVQEAFDLVMKFVKKDDVAQYGTKLKFHESPVYVAVRNAKVDCLSSLFELGFSARSTTSAANKSPFDSYRPYSYSLNEVYHSVRQPQPPYRYLLTDNSVSVALQKVGDVQKCEKIISMLLDQDANPNSNNDYDLSPLCFFAFKTSDDFSANASTYCNIWRMLVDRGADLYWRSARMPLRSPDVVVIACLLGHLPLVRHFASQLTFDLSALLTDVLGFFDVMGGKTPLLRKQVGSSVEALLKMTAKDAHGRETLRARCMEIERKSFVDNQRASAKEGDEMWKSIEQELGKSFDSLKSLSRVTIVKSIHRSTGLDICLFEDRVVELGLPTILQNYLL